MPSIKVNEKVLAHLSRGLYRSPASALRELVSNAWDANATIVSISTDCPTFNELSVRDNGWGFDKDSFRQLMDGGIGASVKSQGPTTQEYDRPVIGRLGIGMLGIAQICLSYTVISNPRNGEGFKARVSLYELPKPKLDADDPAEGDAAIETKDVGTYNFLEYDPDEMDGTGTLVTADDIHPTFIRSFSETLPGPEKLPSNDWPESVRTTASRARTLRELGNYWRLLWELSASCPVPYATKDVVPKGLISNVQDQLCSYNFRLVVDDVELTKPICLVGNKDGYTTYKINRNSVLIDGRQLSFHGYVVVQEARQLQPDELRGIGDGGAKVEHLARRSKR